MTDKEKLMRKYSMPYTPVKRDLILFLEDYGVKVIINEKEVLSPYKIDIYLPDYNIGINAKNLIESVEQNSDEKYLFKNMYNKAKEKNIRLIQILEDEWFDKKNIVKERLIYFLKLEEFKNIGGRKTIIKQIDSREKNIFLENHHVQGKDNTTYKLGAFYEDELIALMTFGKKRVALGNRNKQSEGVYELIRYAVEFRTNAQGIASKLFSYFVKNYEPKEIITFSDNRWNTGNFYEKLGFEFQYETQANYFYVIDGKRKHRFNFRKQNLPKHLENFNPEMTEYENMLVHGYDRIWDAGNKKYEIKF